jgi:hypothetical protein
MSEQAKCIARRFRKEVVSTGDMELADELLAPDFRYYGPPSLGAEPSDREGLKQLIGAYRQASLTWAKPSTTSSSTAIASFSSAPRRAPSPAT